MKLLLTSAGVTNESIRRALVGLLGKPIHDCRAVHIPTAVYAFPSGPLFATQMANHWAELGWRELGALELTAIPSLEEQYWLPTLEASDAILVAGGNNGYLSYWFHESDLARRLPALLENAVYVGISAGSILLTSGFNYDPERLSQTGIYYDDEYDEAAPPGAGDHRGLKLVDFHLRPHLFSDDFPDMSVAKMERAAARVGGKLYAIDDQSAIVVDGSRIEVVSEGQWRRFDADPPARQTSVPSAEHPTCDRG
jgi:dipeptidase E